ncbi:MAG: CHAD domain-containing protein [Alphaproteobacteria bacterium]|nr:CHAD domain-containing protein [Alphaproteobacteria bacterium]
MQLEQELKLAIAPEDAARLRRLASGWPAVRRRRAQHQLTIYFDTAERALKEGGMALRIRNAGRRRLQTLKLEGDAIASLSTRPEWEQPVRGERPDLASLPPAARALLPEAVREDPGLLRPVFVTDIRRTFWDVGMDGGARVEMVLDEGEIRAGRRREKVCEIELELKEGPAVGLVDFATSLGRDIPFQLEPWSKSARGYRLAARQAPPFVKADLVALAPEMSAREAFIAVMRGCLAQLEANEACARDGREPEGVHQMRVALRRMRSALAVFDACLPAALQGELREELRWITRELGPTRDWDVFVEETVRPLALRLSEAEQFRPLLAAGAKLRRAGYAQVREAIQSHRYTAMKLCLLRWLTREDWQDVADEAAREALAEPVGELARQVLRARDRKLRKVGEGHEEFTVEELHELRIRAKKMRYAAEFFRRLYPRKPVKRYLSRMAVLQEVLGAINDAAVGRQRLDEAHAALGAPGGQAPSLVWADGVVSGWLAARMMSEVGRFAELWSDFRAQKPFWNRVAEPVRAAPD